MNKVEKTNLVLFSTGQFISLFGSAIYSFAMSLYVLKLTGSGLSYAINLVLTVMPTVLIGPLAGVLADRFNKKLLVVSMNFANAVLFALLFVAGNNYGLILPVIYIATFITNVISVVFGISIESAKPVLVSANNLIKINLASQLINSLSSILGPVIGGLVFAFTDIKYFILINSLSLLCSGISELFMNFDFNTGHENDEPAEAKDMTIGNIVSDIREGFLYTFKQKELKDSIGVFLLLNIMLGFSVMVGLPYAINNVLKLDSASYGIVQSFLPVGAILGAIAVGRLYREALYNRVINLSVLSFSAVNIAMGIPLLSFADFSKELCVAYYSVLMIATGVIISFVDILAMQKLQTVADEEYRGRVISTTVCACKAALPISLIIAGFIIEVLPVLWVFLGTGCLSMLYAVRRIYISAREFSAIETP